MAAVSYRNRFSTDSALLLDGLATAIVWLDPELRILYTNSSAADLLELPHSVYGRALTDLLSGFHPLAALLREQILKREIRTYREVEISLGRRSITLDCVATPIVPEELVLELYPLDRHLLISREDALTERHQANRMLLLRLAHEIRNPLGGVRGAAQLLESELHDPALLDYTRIILSEVDRLNTLVETLIGPLSPPRPIPLNIHEPIEHVIHLAEAERLPHLRLKRDFDPSLPEIALDRDLLVPALINLVRNAREALEDHGVLSVRSRVERQYTIQGLRHPLAIRIDIEDDGPGVPVHLRERLFLPLVSGRSGGCGLGLAIAQDLIQRQGGLIEWRSRPGQTVFSILLPLVDSHHDN
ncbi:signal transduction histidine kinase, nitrogen specific, NtrB [mine drainage metagenome]|uniref:Signal transduction histidine kinase, nitrogen specific, NtrB n=1 Tax=mine drainage metagenome TaxID=410659 RepID=T1BPI8_9ZZZZ